MQKQEINNLLDKYFGGQTTLEEEQQLSEILEKDCPAGLEAEQAMFAGFAEMKSEVPELPVNYDSGKSFISGYRKFYSIAASITIFLMFSAVIFFGGPDESVEQIAATKNNEPISKQEAKQELARAFNKIGSAMASGEQELEQIRHIKWEQDKSN